MQKKIPLYEPINLAIMREKKKKKKKLMQIWAIIFLTIQIINVEL